MGRKRKRNPKFELIIDTLAEKYKLDRQVVKAVVLSPFKYFKEVAKDPTDIRPIRLLYFGSFVQRPVYNKLTVMKKKYDRLVRHLYEVYIVMTSILQYPVTSPESAKVVLDYALYSKDLWKMEEIYKAWREYHDSEARKKAAEKREKVEK